MKSFVVFAVIVGVVFGGNILHDLDKLERDVAELENDHSSRAFLEVSDNRCTSAGGTCKPVAECGGSTLSGKCSGPNNIKCCIPSNNGGGGSDTNASPAPAGSPATAPPTGSGGLSAPYLPTSGPEGSNGGPCTQGQRGRCTSESSCDTNAGYRAQTGRCNSGLVCCTPKNAGGQNDVIPAKFFQQGALCYPVTRETFERTGSDYGSGRPVSASNPNRMKRCHSGQDIFTKRVSGQNVVAVDDGEITIRPSGCFTTCSDGWGMRKHGGQTSNGCAGNLLIYHPALDRTINYGEIDFVNMVKKSGTVRKGEKIGVASVCGMLHFEIYKGRQTSNFRWYPTRECERNNSGCQRPAWASEQNMCAKHAIALKNPVNLDPRPYLDLLSPSSGKGSWC